MLNRVKVWDELRGIAISFMIVVHFFYYNSSIYYKLSIFNIVYNVSGIYEFSKGLLNLHTSFLAPFLFLFIVGVISHIKFSKQTGPDFIGVLKRFLKLFLSTMLLSLILPVDFNRLSRIDYLKLPYETLMSDNILMIIAYVYLINEFILHWLFNYYHKNLSTKALCLIGFGILIIIFNISAKTLYRTYHDLPVYLIVLFGAFTSLLGDWFISVQDEVEEKNKKLMLILNILIPTSICLAAAIWLRPEMGAIKEMNIMYFMYCFSLTAAIIAILNSEKTFKLFQLMKSLLSLLGRHSLGLYIFHFFIGASIEKFFLSRFVEKPYWPVNIIMLFIACIVFAMFLDKIQDSWVKSSVKPDRVI